MQARLVLLCVFPLVACSQTISFQPPVTLTGGGASSGSDCSACVAVADFNRDGMPDIAYNTATPFSQSGVLLGNGDGTFRLVPGVSLAQQPLLVGDFNGDGNPDILFARFSAGYYPGKGDGTFESLPVVTGCPIPAAPGASPPPVYVADFNLDGRTDVLCGGSIVLSKDGGFESRGMVASIAPDSPALIADFNKDRIPDILFRNAAGGVSAVLGRGDGTFASEQSLANVVISDTPWSFFAGDFNGDGKIDLIDLTAQGDKINFRPGKGDGTFGAAIQTETFYLLPGIPTTAADFNRDGKLDFVAGDLVFAGNGDGTFRFPVAFGPTSNPCGSLSGVRLSCAYSHLSTATGDFNGDGLPDLALYVANRPGVVAIKYSGNVNVLLNDSPGNGFNTPGVSAATNGLLIAPGSIVSAYGKDLATETAIAATNPPPTTLGGIRVHVRDRSHLGYTLAPLLYVSPTQINYVLDSTDPYAWVDIERVGVPYAPHGMTVPIVPLAPGFFSASYTATAPGYLSLYGTGFAKAVTAGSQCSVGGVSASVTYAGPQLQIAGLDQVNIQLPTSLSRTGVQQVRCVLQTADEFTAVSNTVQATIE